MPNKIIIALGDIPQRCSQEEKMVWRKKIRKQLGIKKNAYVYCYNGSAKPWQCPDDIVQFFSEKLRNNTNTFLLILSQDTDRFLSILKKNHVADRYYRVLHIPHDHIYWYLAAADSGLLFREPHIINWVSRPTKALEYHAVGLTVIHNNTVAYLLDASSKTSSHRRNTC